MAVLIKTAAKNHHVLYNNIIVKSMGIMNITICLYNIYRY